MARVKKDISVAKDGLESSVAKLRELISSNDLDSIPEIQQLRDRLDDGLSQIQDSALSFYKQAKRGTAKAAKATERYVRDEPWHVLGGALVVGALIGYLLRRR